jgi:glycosyltransferase involved in cell wall biosynthesis
MFIVVFLHMTNKVATIVVRDNCIPVIMSLPLRLLGIPFIYRAISTPFASLEIGVLEFRGPIDKIHRVLTRIFDMVALSRASKILTSSPDAENLILSKLSVPKDRIALVPYSIPDFFFEQEKCTQEELLRRTAEKMTLTYFGSLNEIYSFENLLGAMRVLKNDGYDLRLTIYGDGPNKRHIISRVAELDLQGDVIINDTVSRARVPDLYRFATAAVVPYSGKLERGVSLKSIEAMALRVPVIISKQSDALYVNGKNCIVLGSDSVDAWVISIKKVTNSYVRQELIKGGIETAKIFRRPVVTELLRQTVDSVVSGKIAGDGKDIPR